MRSLALRQVRAAVRALTLNVYGIADEAVQRFLCTAPASDYFTDLAILITEQCQVRAPPRPAFALPQRRVGMLCGPRSRAAGTAGHESAQRAAARCLLCPEL